jgi:hypothetical protein
MSVSTKVRDPAPPTLREDLADVIERVWITKFGRVPVVAQAVLARIRRGNP